MRIALIGHASRAPVEGTRNVHRALATGLQARGHDVQAFDWRRVLARPTRLAGYRADVHHWVVGGAGPLPYVASAGLARLGRRPLVVMSLLQCGGNVPRLARLFAPDLCLVQSEATEAAVRAHRIRAHPLANGVDTGRFEPVPPARKRVLRRALGLPEAKRVVLHVGHLARGRNVQALESLDPQGHHILFVASPHGAPDEGLRRELGRWADVRTGLQERVEEFYQAADCYVFPTLSWRSCIETPLSVLEAMATDLPVVTTPFGSLPRLFPHPVDGLVFWTPDEPLGKAVDLALQKQPSTAQAVARYAWPATVRDLERAYAGIRR